MRVVLIASTLPPVNCGIGIHAHLLAQALREAGAHVELVTPPSRPTFAPGTVCHIQYPGVLYGHMWVVAQAIRAKRAGARVVVTIHEYTSLRRHRVVAEALAALSDRLIFTTSAEAAAYAQWHPRRSTEVITPASLIPETESGAIDRRLVINFGLLTHNAYRYNFLADMMTFLRPAGFRLRVVGGTYPDARDALDSAKGAMRLRGVEDLVDFVVDTPSETLPQVLKDGVVGVLPYHDGVSLRRSTLLGLMASGVPVVTNEGLFTPDSFKDGATVLFAHSPADAATAVQKICSDDGLRLRLQDAGRRFVHVLSWGSIARRTLEVYSA